MFHVTSSKLHLHESITLWLPHGIIFLKASPTDSFQKQNYAYTFKTENSVYFCWFFVIQSFVQIFIEHYYVPNTVLGRVYSDDMVLALQNLQLKNLTQN